MEVKFYNGTFQIIEGKFYRHLKNGDLHPWFDPIRQVQKQKEALSSYLHHRDIHVYVRDLVVLAHGRLDNIQGRTGVYVVEKDKLIDFVKNIADNLAPLETNKVLEAFV